MKVPSRCFLGDGTVPSRCFLGDGTVPSRYFLGDGTVPSRYFLEDGTVPSPKHYQKKKGDNKLMLSCAKLMAQLVLNPCIRITNNWLVKNKDTVLDVQNGAKLILIYFLSLTKYCHPSKVLVHLPIRVIFQQWFTSFKGGI